MSAIIRPSMRLGIVLRPKVLTAWRIRLGLSKQSGGVKSNYFRYRDIRSAEVLPLKQERLSGRLCERVSETIAEVQSGRMTAFPEVEKGLPRQVGVLDGDWLDDNLSAAKENIALTAGIRANLSFDHHCKLHKIGGADAADVGVMDDPYITVGFGLSEKDGRECGGVENHFGRPRSSYRNSE